MNQLEVNNRDKWGGDFLNSTNFLIASLTLVALISIQPFFIWSHSKLYYSASTLLLCLSYLFYFKNVKQFNWDNLVFILCCLFFLIYITLLPKANHQHVRWIFLMPFIVAYFSLPFTLQKKVCEFFSLSFLLTLLPGILILLLMILAIPVPFTTMDSPVSSFSQSGVYYLCFPGAIFINTNSILLPNGGILSRLCGIWGEPGTVGTVCALLLAAEGFQLKHFRSKLIWLAGFLAFSLAFFALFLIGACLFSLLERRFNLIAYVLLSILGVCLSLGTLSPMYDGAKKDFIQRVDEEKKTKVTSKLLIDSSGRKISLGTSLRQNEIIDNRSSMQMNELFREYLFSDIKTLLLGIASDASDVYGGDNKATWKIIFTNYGVIGFLLLMAIFLYYACLFVKSKNNVTYIALFFFLFFLSFYQRPIIWLPFYFVIFSGGIIGLSSRFEQQEMHLLGAETNAV
nr:hypothetical protein [Legionella jordanis]